MIDEPNRQPLLRTYATAALGARRAAVGVIFLFGTAGALEAGALAFLLPLLESVSSDAAGSGPLGRDLLSFGLSPATLQWVAVSAFIAGGVGSAIARQLADSRLLKLRTQYAEKLSNEMSGLYLDMEWSAFLKMRFGEVAVSLMGESNQVATGYHALIMALGAAATTLVFIVLAVLLSPLFTMVALVFGLVIVTLLRPLALRLQEHTRALTRATDEIGSQVGDVLGNLKFFRSTGTRERGKELFRSANAEYAESQYRTQIGPYVIRMAYELSGVAFIGVVLIIAIATTGGLPARTLVFLAVFYRLSPRVREIQTQFVRARVQLPWLLRWMEREEIIRRVTTLPHGGNEPTFNQSLQFSDVSFVFPETEAGVLDGLSWQIQQGQCVALVGGSGAGKTTTLDLVSGLLLPTRGAVTLDGVPLSEIDVESWQSRIGLVLQESPIFHASVTENVCGDREVDEAKVWDCLERAYAREFVEALPDGLSTSLGLRGGRLSGGQRQRLALARALYRDPWLLILDEATSALDAHSEQIVIEALEELKGEVAMLVVTHRLATVRFVDEIHVLEHGTIVQSGRWGDLLEGPGPFRDLALRQGLGVLVE